MAIIVRGYWKGTCLYGDLIQFLWTCVRVREDKVEMLNTAPLCLAPYKITTVGETNSMGEGTDGQH